MAIHGFHIVSESLLTLHPDYENRLEKVGDFSCLEIYTLSANGGNPFRIISKSSMISDYIDSRGTTKPVLTVKEHP